MPQLSEHQSAETTKLLLVGDSGCLAGSTVLSVKRGLKMKKMYLADLYKLANGKHFNKKTEHTELLADLGGHAGPLQMLKIIQSGEKELLRISAGGREIKASFDHQFSTEFGWLKAEDLKIGMRVAMWRSRRSKLVRNRDANYDRKGRVTVYSIPFHPFAQDNWVAGRNYKRYPRARLVIEAAINGLDLNELIAILRSDEEKASSLQYLPNDVDVHHLDGNPANDLHNNLQIINRQTHIDLHHKEKVQASKGIELEEITSIEELPAEMTYDIMMPPPHNFIANGFVVHNSGKSGALASLAADGYRLRIVDLDNGLDVLKNLLTEPTSEYVKKTPKAADNVTFVTVTDPMKNVGGRLQPSRATVWQRTVGLLQDWKELDRDGKPIAGSELGPITSWGPQDVLVIDSLTMLSNAALAFVLAMNGRLGQHPQLQDWGAGQQLIESLVQMLYDESVKCNVVLNCHIVFVGDQGQEKGYPNTLGKALPPKIGRYFNSILMAQSVGRGSAVKRKILTQPTGIIELKNTAPMRVQAEYPLEWGLAEYFKAVRGQ